MVLATPVFTQTENVKITITGIENTKGNIVIGIYDSENTFPDFGKEFQGAKVKPTKAESINYTFKDLPAGTYAIAVWHDENDNQKIDKKNACLGSVRSNCGACFTLNCLKDISGRCDDGSVTTSFEEIDCSFYFRSHIAWGELPLRHISLRLRYAQVVERNRAVAGVVQINPIHASNDDKIPYPKG